jgi:hypothetical protein
VSAIAWSSKAQPDAPHDPIEIGTASQLFIDNYIVDNTWTLRYKTQHIDRVFHQPVKHVANPRNRSQPAVAVTVSCSSRRSKNWRNHRHVAADHAGAVSRLAA